MLVVAADVPGELGPVAGEVLRGGRLGHKANVEVVGRAAQHPAAEAGPGGHHAAPAFELLHAARRDEGEADGVTGARRGVGHLVPELGVMLHVVQHSDRRRASASAGMGHHVHDLLAVEPDLPALVAKPGQVLAAGACGHYGLLRAEVCLRRMRRPRTSSTRGVRTGPRPPRRRLRGSAGTSRRTGRCRLATRS